jgi:hypothetical protein
VTDNDWNELSSSKAYVSKWNGHGLMTLANTTHPLRAVVTAVQKLWRAALQEGADAAALEHI